MVLDTIQPQVVGIFADMGIFILLCVLALVIYQASRMYKSIAETQLHYAILEDTLLKNVAKKRGIDLEKEMMKRNVMNSYRKSLQKQIKEEMYKEMFPEKKK